MKSNFDFLQTEFPVLSTFGCQAEKYCFSDPNSCLMKLGMIGESIVNLMFTYDRIQLPYDNTAVTRIDTLQREGLLTRDLTDILHALRKARNKAVHENYDSESECKILLQMAYSLCEWFMQTYGDWNYQHHDFIMPELENKRVSVTQEEKAAEERQAEELTKQAEQKASTAEAISKSERQKQAGKMASQRPKSEAETRYIIDEQLRQVGWEADTENLRYSKGTRPAKGHNMAIAEWPTNSSVGQSGRVDYALFVDTKLIGVIEAKAIHKDIPSVIDYQGKEYPRNIRKEDSEYQIGEWGEYKVPFTFATNGRPYLKQLETKSGIWFLDLRSPANNPTALHGWISPMGMVELLEKNPQEGNSALKALPYDFLTDPNGLNLREYQLNAIKAAEQSVIEGKKNILLAMATGTGKTRTVLGMIYRFLKTNRFKRILFLVDRTSLGEQASDVFKEIKLEDLMTLDEIYNIKGLEDKNIDKETRHITLAYFEQKSTVDYIGAVQGIPVCFDAKECNTDTFPLANVHPHQVAFMEQFEKQEGIAFLLISFTHREEFYYLRFSDLEKFWNRALDGGRKSFRYEELNPAYFLPKVSGVLIPYLQVLQKDLEDRD